MIKGFPHIPPWFRKVFPYSKWGAELNARITPAFFSWLVGPMQTEIADVNGIQQHSSVHIKRCRYHGSLCMHDTNHSTTNTVLHVYASSFGCELACKLHPCCLHDVHTAAAYHTRLLTNVTQIVGGRSISDRGMRGCTLPLQVLSRERLCWHVCQSVQDANTGILHRGTGYASDHEAQLRGLQL